MDEEKPFAERQIESGLATLDRLLNKAALEVSEARAVRRSANARVEAAQEEMGRLQVERDKLSIALAVVRR